MKKKSVKKADPILVIGFTLILLFLIIGFLNGGMVQFVMGIIALVGTVIIIIYSIIQIANQQKCPICGTKTQTHDDKYCRVCGASLTK